MLVLSLLALPLADATFAQTGATGATTR